MRRIGQIVAGLVVSTVALSACTASRPPVTTPRAKPSVPSNAALSSAVALYDSWKSGNRVDALRVAAPNAVRAVFRHPWSQADAQPTQCDFDGHNYNCAPPSMRFVPPRPHSVMFFGSAPSSGGL